MFDRPEELQEIIRDVWREKYRYTKADGSSEEDCPADSMVRVINGVFAKDRDEVAIGKTLRRMLLGQWCPGGRIHAGAGTDKVVTLLNCFVSPSIPDSMNGIMDGLSNAALTQQQGGGIGTDFSTLRPRGAIVRRTQSVSSGVIPFMKMWDSMCSTIRSSGDRRGAMMATLRCDHPDVFEFIKAKREKGILKNFNVSVLVTEDFMDSVAEEVDWDLGFTVPRADGKHITSYQKAGETWFVYERVPARDLWNLILESTFTYSEPGVVFIDRVNELNNLNYLETISCTNPCGEQPLPPNGDCNLGAVNLAVMVKEPFTDNAQVKWTDIEATVRVGVRFLDNVLDVTGFPTVAQQQEAYAKRRIGLGITGLGNYLQQLGLRYGSKDAVDLTERTMQCIAEAAYDESANLALVRGCFPLYSRGDFLAAPFVKNLSEQLRLKISENGIRNGVILTVAPTGTTSIYYGNVSSGLEPTFLWKYKRKVRQEDGESWKEYDVDDYGYLLYKQVTGVDIMEKHARVPDYMVTTADLTVDDHLAMQAAVQSWVDASVSKTINCPKEITLEEFREVYEKAYKMGCKGCTTYRPSEVRGSILSAGEEKNTSMVPRPKEMDGKTYKVNWPGIEAAFYVTINNLIEGSQRRPFEMFINSKSVIHQEWITALTRTVSAVLRRGNASFLVDELQQVYSPMGGQYTGGEYVPSMVAMIGKVLENHIGELQELEKMPQYQEGNGLGEICGKCNRPAVFWQEGCETCKNCGASSCG